MSNRLYRIEILQPRFDELYAEYEELFAEPDISTLDANADSIDNDLHIHPEIKSKCKQLYSSGAYAEAVEKSFKVVKDKLRLLTNYESGSDAFGKGKLHVLGASAPNVDEDFNKAALFLMMAIDMFRNEKSHTSDAHIGDPVRAYQYLAMSSLAMSLLDNSEIKV